MNLTDARRLFTQRYPDGWICRGKEVGGCVPSRWAVFFGGENRRIYEYGGALRNVLIRVLKLTDEETDRLWQIPGRCANGCPLPSGWTAPRCPNCGSQKVTYYAVPGEMAKEKA